MKRRKDFLFTIVFLYTCFAKALEITDISKIQHPDTINDYEINKSSVSEVNYFYTWTDATKMTDYSPQDFHIGKISFSNDNEVVRSNNEDYQTSDMVAMLTPIKYRIIPYNDKTRILKNIEYIATVDKCYKGPCHNTKTIHYRHSHDSGDSFGAPTNLPMIIFLRYDKSDNVYYQLDNWSYIRISKEMFETIQKRKNNQAKTIKGRKNEK